MTAFFKKIQELEEFNHLTKHEQLVNGIINAIEEKIIIKGSMLPSVNKMVKELGFARKTIVKAYTDLKDRGIVESKNRLGYYIANESTDQTIKVALILYAFHTFQEEFYNSFRASLGENIQLDVFFHHSNMSVFESIFSNISDKYGIYVVAPIQNEKSRKLLKTIPPNKLLLIDRYLDLNQQYSHITQEFRKPMYDVLSGLFPTISSFKKCVLFFRPKDDNPIGVLKGFEEFIKDNNLNSEVKSYYEPNSVSKGSCYFIQNDNDLWELLKDCKNRNLEIGKDIGILSFNESTIKEFVMGGITTISTDFVLMAQKAAEFVLHRKTNQEVIVTTLIRRASL